MSGLKIFLLFTGLLNFGSAFAANPCHDRYPFQTWVEMTDVSEHFRGFRRQDFPRDSWNLQGSQVNTLNAENPTQLLSICEFEYFVLSFEWYVTGHGNGGIKYQVQEKLGAVGLEYQMVDPASGESIQTPVHVSGALYDILAPIFTQWSYSSGHWNSGVIIVRQDRVEHWLNGKLILSYDFDSPEYAAGLDKSKFATKPQFRTQSSGRILLQHHGERVSYRNLKIKRLK